MTHVTCRLTANNRDQLRNPTLGNPVWATFTFLLANIASYRISFLDCGRCTWFERISMAVILLNCVTLGMFQPCDDIVCSSLRCRILEAFDHAIFVFFAAEMCVKVCAMGLFGKRAYLGDTWNRLDLFIVVAGYPLLYCSVSFCPKPPSRIVFPVKP